MNLCTELHREQRYENEYFQSRRSHITIQSHSASVESDQRRMTPQRDQFRLVFIHY